MSLPESFTDQSKTTTDGPEVEASRGIAHIPIRNDSLGNKNLLEAGNASSNNTGGGRKIDSVQPSLDSERQSSQQAERLHNERDGQDNIGNSDVQTDRLSASLASASIEMGVTERDAAWEEDPKARQEMDTSGEIYLDPTPKTPRQGTSPNREASDVTEAQADEGSTSEIQSIMDQFDDGDDTEGNADDADLGHNTSRLRSPLEHPPRRSSLEPLRPISSKTGHDSMDNDGLSLPNTNPTLSSNEALILGMEAKSPVKGNSSVPQSAPFDATDANTPSSPAPSKSMSKMPPPAPDPEPDLPFDFHRFLEQLRHRTADPVAKFLRSFLVEFGKKPWMAHEQVKIINDFLTFITNKMAQCEVWRGTSDGEFDNAKEGMEKLVMNRLYSQTFSPAIPAPTTLQSTKGKKKITEKLPGLGRKGQHQEDIERDEILGQKVRIYGWVEEEHLDIPRVGDSGRRFLLLAQQGTNTTTMRRHAEADWKTELLKIKTYRAPRDKIICVLNCCKVIFGKALIHQIKWISIYLTSDRSSA